MKDGLEQRKGECKLIEITHSEGCITVKGHADYAPIGQDIVCAGVSVLVQTLIQSMEEICTDEIQYDMQPGSVEIRYGELTVSAKTLLVSFFIGVQMIADEYPNNVRIVQAV